MEILGDLEDFFLHLLKQTNMQIINIIEKYHGHISNIISYPIFSEENTKAVVEAAEKKYREIIVTVKGIQEEELLDTNVEDGYYHDNEGWVLLLSWSDEVPMVVQGFALVD